MQQTQQKQKMLLCDRLQAYGKINESFLNYSKIPVLVSMGIFSGGIMYFGYQDGEMQVEGVTLEKIAQEVGTPFYCYSYGQLAENLNAYRRALAPFHASICYSVKANSSLAVVSAVAALGGDDDGGHWEHD